MAVKRTNCYEQALACDLFEKFCNASTVKEILQYHQNLCRTCSLSPTNFPDFYPKIKAKIPSWKASDLWAKLDKRASQTCYGRGTISAGTRVLIIGAGPCGLRTAIEAQLLGNKTVVIEKRSNFTRNNILHLWPFAIADLRNLGAKVFYGKFCAGSIDHISIRQLQIILLKVALLLGVEVHTNVSFEGLIEPKSEDDLGWKATLNPSQHPAQAYIFDVIIGADGRKSTLPGFQRKTLRAKLAIAITCNFKHNHTEAEARVAEISGVSYIFKQQFFNELEEAMGIGLENIVYYKDDTHYFVMTPTKQSLLDKGVLFEDFSDPEKLLSPENVDQEALQLFTIQAVIFATNNQLPKLEFATNSRNQPDVAIIDFTTMRCSENSCRAVEIKGHKLLMGLVGDSLLEPFWPMGTGIARGWLAAFDAAFMIRSWSKGLKSVLEVLAERESIHHVLAQTTHANLNKDYNLYSIEPITRYPKINLCSVGARQVKHLFDSDEPIVDIFLSIRDSKRCRLVSENVLLKWFQTQLLEMHILLITSLPEVFTNGQSLIAIIRRFRPDLVDFAQLQTDNLEEKRMNNQCSFDILMDEYNVSPVIDADQSLDVTDLDIPMLIQYLSQVYNIYKGEIPKTLTNTTKNEVFEDEQHCMPSAPNNTALHHSLSIKQFVEAKEQFRKKRAHDEAQSRKRSQLYESIMETERNANPQRSTSITNIPVVKFNPVPASDLFSACRGGSDREKCKKPTIPSDTMALIKLARSRSDVGHKSKGLFGLSQPPPPTHLKARRSELEEVQLRIRKSKAAPLGDIVSTFLGKHINQTSGCLSNEESDGNALSNERRLLKPSRPASVYQNLNDQEEDQENVEEQSPNPFFNNPEQDPGFKERCKFLEKRLYNSGRDIKVHIGAAWFQKADSKKDNPSSSCAGGSLEKPNQSSCLTAGFHPLPLKRGSSFNARSTMEQSFNNRKKEADIAEKEFNPKALFLKERLSGLCHHVAHGQSEEKSPSPKPHFHHRRPQQNGTVLLAAKTEQNNKDKSKKEKKINATPSVSAVDSDLDCFLNAIDFNGIDGQDLQELLSSY